MQLGAAQLMLSTAHRNRDGQQDGEQQAGGNVTGDQQSDRSANGQQNGEPGERRLRRMAEKVLRFGEQAGVRDGEKDARENCVVLRMEIMTLPRGVCLLAGSGEDDTRLCSNETVYFYQRKTAV